MAIGQGHFLPLFIVLVILFFLGSRHLASARVFASDVAVRTSEDEEISKMTISQLKDFLNARGVSHSDVIERKELERRAKLAYAKRREAQYRQRASGMAVRTSEDEEISKMTISQLKDFLYARGVSHSDISNHRQELERRAKLAYSKPPHRQIASASEKRKRKKPALPDHQINEEESEFIYDHMIIEKYGYFGYIIRLIVSVFGLISLYALPFLLLGFLVAEAPDPDKSVLRWDDILR